MEKNDFNKQTIEGVAINPADATKIVKGLVDDENFFKHMLNKLGDALQLVASPGCDDLGIPENQLAVLEALSKARKYFHNMLGNIEKFKKGELPDYLTEE